MVFTRYSTFISAFWSIICDGQDRDAKGGNQEDSFIHDNVWLYYIVREPWNDCMKKVYYTFYPLWEWLVNDNNVTNMDWWIMD